MHSTAPSTSELDPSGAHHDELASLTVMLRVYHGLAAECDGVFVMTVIDTDGKVHPQQFAIGDVEGMALEAARRGRVANVYFAPAVYRKNLPPGSRGTAKDIIAVLGLVIDDDSDTSKRAVLPPEISPTFELTTSSQPVVNRHLHLVLKRPLPPNEAKSLAALLHRKCGGDFGTGDIAHIWRLAQTLNYPNSAKLARGRPPAPQSVDLAGGTRELVDPDDLRRELEVMPDINPLRKSKKKPNGTNGGGNGHAPRGNVCVDDLHNWVRELIAVESDDRSAHCFRVMTVLMEHGLTDGDIRYLATQGPFAKKFLDRGDLEEEIARAREKWTGEIRFNLKGKGNGANGTAHDGGAHNAHAKNRDKAPPSYAEMPAPDMSIIQRNLVPAPTFPCEILGEVAAEWVKRTAECKNAPVSFVALGFLVVTAAMIGPKRYVTPWEGWTEPSILWGVLVGRPSVKKSPALDSLRDAVRALERELNLDWEERKRTYEKDKREAEARRAVWEAEITKAVQAKNKTKEKPLTKERYVAVKEEGEDGQL